jgi:hypothetical protein
VTAAAPSDPGVAQPRAGQGGRTLAWVLLSIYLALFLTSSAQWIRWVRSSHRNEPVRPAVGRSVGFGPYGLGVREWSGPMPVAQSPDPFVAAQSSTATGSSSAHGERLYGLVTVGHGSVFGGGTAYSYRDYYLPHHVLWWATLPAPLLLIYGTYHRRRLVRDALREGRCVYCNYDLRATPLRCPECGRPATMSAGSGG